ncbi:MAG TPA: S1 RNA-binding domain-containing protein [Candidatus Paceibacterota bacterium]
MDTKEKDLDTVLHEVGASEDDSSDDTTEEGKRKKKDEVMSRFVSESPTPPQEGDLVEGPVIAIEKSSVYIDVPPFGTGIIYGREFLNASDILRKVNLGDIVAAKVVETESRDGYIELSLKEARQALIWSEAESAIANMTVFELPIKDANKGGLIIEWQGIQGFLPASQLKSEHYPRVESGDKDRILDELKKLIGERLAVSIITADPKEGKLIFSEKDPEKKEKGDIIDHYTVGDVVEGDVTGMVDFGVFVKIEEGLEGLVHISEMDWGLVEDPRTMYSVGDKISVKIIEIKDGKISLSIKALKQNPWEEASQKYKKGDTVPGVVIKHNKHGALISIEEGVAGLVHISDFGSEEKLRESLELGKSYPFTITLFEPEEQRMTLSHIGEKAE